MGPRASINGLKVIGQPIAERIAAAGFPLAVYDVRPQPVSALITLGAQDYRCPGEVADSSEIVISLVLDEKETAEVLFGADGAPQGPGNVRLAAIGSMVGLHPVQRYALVQQAGVRLHLGAQA